MASEQQSDALEQRDGESLTDYLERREQTVNEWITEADTEMESEYWHGQYDLVRVLQDKIESGLIELE